jgi:hypothetical protein
MSISIQEPRAECSLCVICLGATYCKLHTYAHQAQISHACEAAIGRPQHTVIILGCLRHAFLRHVSVPLAM